MHIPLPPSSPVSGLRSLPCTPQEFKKKHLSQAYNVRVSTNGKVLADYSQSSYALPWSQGCWWNKPVVVYGDKLHKDHPVVQFLAREGRCARLAYFREGYEAFEAEYGCVCTASVKASSMKRCARRGLSPPKLAAGS